MYIFKYKTYIVYHIVLLSNANIHIPELIELPLIIAYHSGQDQDKGYHHDNKNHH